MPQGMNKVEEGMNRLVESPEDFADALEFLMAWSQTRADDEEQIHEGKVGKLARKWQRISMKLATLIDEVPEE